MTDSNASKSAKLAKEQKWAEEDATFLRALSTKKKNMTEMASSSSSSSGIETQRSIDTINHSRQRYLRSYPLSDDKEKTNNKGIWKFFGCFT